MSHALETLKQTLAGTSNEDKILAVLALPDAARAATPILEAALDGADLKLKVVLFDALYRLNQDPGVEQELIAILDSPEAQSDDGEELYMMARIALNRAQGDAADAIRGEAEGVRGEVLGGVTRGGAEKLAVIIHGTWASGTGWWRSGGDFHTYLRTTLGLDHLYDGKDPFKWSGHNRDAARDDAAMAFGYWVTRHDSETLEVYAHSHGANVAMLSTQKGIEIAKLVMLSPPVRPDYHARWDLVGEAYNIQAKFDPVVGIAHGGRWFDLGDQVREKELPIFGHSVSHDPRVWEKYKVPEFVGLRDGDPEDEPVR